MVGMRALGITAAKRRRAAAEIKADIASPRFWESAWGAEFGARQFWSPTS